MEDADDNDDDDDDEEDRRPLIEDAEGHRKQGVSGKERRGRAAPPSHGSLPSVKKKKKKKKKKERTATRTSGRDMSLRKSKSLEAVSSREHGDGEENKDGEMDRNKAEARKNMVKEKVKFSAFLNEITRQVLSPSRLTSLGVTDAGRPRSPGQASGRSSRVEGRPAGPGPQRSRPASADSIHSSGSSSPESVRLAG